MLKLLESRTKRNSVKDLVRAVELARRTKTLVPLCGMAFQLIEAAPNWIDDVGGKTSSEIVRRLDSTDGTDIGNDDRNL